MPAPIIAIFLLCYLFSAEIYQFLVQPYSDAVISKEFKIRIKERGDDDDEFEPDVFWKETLLSYKQNMAQKVVIHKEVLYTPL